MAVDTSPEPRENYRAASNTPLFERITLVVGLVFCATVVLRFAAVCTTDFTAYAPAELAQAFQQYRRRADMFGLPLGISTFVLLLLGVNRWRDLRAWRVRLRLITVALLPILLATNWFVVTPREQWFAAPGTADPSLLTAELQHLLYWHWLRLGFAIALAVLLVITHRAPLPAVSHAALDALNERQRRLLLLLGSATLFEGYDRFITSLALPYIGDELGAGESALGRLLAVIRVGALLSIVLGRFADRHGRRRLLIVSVIVYTVATAATGFSRGVIDFALYQLVAVVFLTAELSIAQVVIAEEFPARMRGFGQGALGATVVFGAGVAAVLFPILHDTPFGWRGMYLIGVLPLTVVAYLRRNLPETRRWQQLGEPRLSQPRISDLLRGASRRPLLALTALSAAASAAVASGIAFASHRATTVFQWEPSQVSAMIVSGGAVGFCGYFIIGRIVDAIGRRIVAAVGLVGIGLALALYYRTDRLMLALAGITLSDAAVLIAINSLTTEIFPTALRVTAKSWVSNGTAVGAVIGLATIGVAGEVASAATVITLLGCVCALLSPLILLLPETARAELFELEPFPGDARAQGTGTADP